MISFGYKPSHTKYEWQVRECVVDHSYYDSQGQKSVVVRNERRKDAKNPVHD